MSREETLKEINALLKNNIYEDNILQYYDNVTYNIRFYMLHRVIQETLTEIRSGDDYNLKETMKKISDDSKIIIAETGVSSKINIKNLTIKSIYPSTATSSPIATYELNLHLQEIGGVSLVNHITAVSKLVGYDCYLLQPFHIDLWFSGYENSTGKPIDIIENKIYTFEVLLSDIKTTNSLVGMEYNFVMIPTATGDFNKEKRLMVDIGEINIDTTNFGELKKRLEEYINDRFKKANPKIAHYFDNTDDNKSYFKFGKSYIRKLLNKKSLSEMIKNINVNNDTVDSIELENFLASNNSKDSTNNVSIRPDSERTLDDLLQDAILNSKNYKNYILRLNYKIINENVDNGQVISRIRADIILTENSYLTYYNKANEMVGNNDLISRYIIDENKNEKLNSLKSSKKILDTTTIEYKERFKLLNENKEDEYINEMATNEIYSLIGENRLRKRYEWQFNGRETSLLEFQSTLDKLWYSNIPLYNVEKNNNNSGDINLKTAVNENFKKYKNSLISTKSVEDLKKLTNYLNAGLDGVRNLSSDKRLYLDDIYYCIDENVRNTFLSGRTIVEKCDLFSEVALQEQNNNLSIGTIIAKTGYENIHSTGNLVELNLKILGDPFWLEPVDDNTIYEPIDSNECGKFNNIAFRLNTTIDESPEGDYDIENIVDFSNIYNVIESTSVFEDGKFIQNLRCILNLAFVHFPKLGV